MPSINVSLVQAKMRDDGLSQRQLAAQLDVSPQTVTNWLKSEAFPHPAQLLKLALKLRIPFDSLVMPEAPQEDAPRVAARARRGRPLGESVLANFRAMGGLLEKLVSYLPFANLESPKRLLNPVTEFKYLQSVSALVREEIGVGIDAPLGFTNLVDRFVEHKAILVPVLWGKKDGHENALHVFLPKSYTTWVYLNLDTYLPDFNFWMAHELGHVYSPTLSGAEAEVFADAFAAALLFPAAVCEHVLDELSAAKSVSDKLMVLHSYATRFSVSIYCVYKEVNNYAAANHLPQVKISQTLFHGVRQAINTASGTVTEKIWGKVSPSAEDYVQEASRIFKSDFFAVLGKCVGEKALPASFVQSVLDVPLVDAKAIVSVCAPDVEAVVPA